jgi:hypothetical protein
MSNGINNFESFGARRGLYCVWIRAHEGQHAPLVSIWIDPQMRAFEERGTEGACEHAVNSFAGSLAGPEQDRQPGEQEHLEDQEKDASVKRRLSPLASSLTLVLFCLFLMPAARSQTTGRITGIVKDQTDAASSRYRRHDVSAIAVTGLVTRTKRVGKIGCAADRTANLAIHPSRSAKCAATRSLSRYWWLTIQPCSAS